MEVTLRELASGDATAMGALAARNRDDIERVDPPRPDSFFTVEGQRARIERIRSAARAGTVRFWTIRIDGALAGDIGVTGIERGPFQSGHLGYLVDREFRNQGVATRASALAVAEAFGPLALHRLDAGVLTTNVASQRVLEKAGFELVGLARGYLFTGGAWRDNLLYQCLGPDRAPTPAELLGEPATLAHEPLSPPATGSQDT